MAELNKFYRCEVCRNIVSVVNAGSGTLTCCDQEMKLQQEQTKASEGAGEKHVPIITVEGETVTVKVGEVPHPMEEKHFITLIQLIDGTGVAMGKRLKPGDKPEAVFHVENPVGLKARALCNIHGVWISDCSDDTC